MVTYYVIIRGKGFQRADANAFSIKWPAYTSLDNSLLGARFERRSTIRVMMGYNTITCIFN